MSLELWIAVAALIVAALGIIITLAVERYRRPRLTVRIGTFADFPKTPRFRILHVIVRNEPKIVASETAINCRGNITVRDFNTDQILLRDIGTKWATKPEPIRPVITPSQAPMYYVDDALLAEAYTEEIAAGGERPLAIAIKFDNESEFYAFGPESYRHNLKKRDYIVNSNKCFVDVSLTADNFRSQTKRFLLENASRDIKDFCLRTA